MGCDSNCQSLLFPRTSATKILHDGFQSTAGVTAAMQHACSKAVWLVQVFIFGNRNEVLQFAHVA